jgi:hypothetical protein
MLKRYFVHEFVSNSVRRAPPARIQLAYKIRFHSLTLGQQDSSMVFNSSSTCLMEFTSTLAACPHLIIYPISEARIGTGRSSYLSALPCIKKLIRK